MNTPVNVSVVSRLCLNFTMLNSVYNHTLPRPIPKCCNRGEKFSLTERQCISMDSNISLQYECSNYSCWNPKNFKVNLTKRDEIYNCKFIARDSMSANCSNEEEFEYCLLAMEKEESNATLVIGLCPRTDSLQETVRTLISWISVILLVTTIILCLAEPELRHTIKNKCFICYLICIVIFISLLEEITYKSIYLWHNLLGDIGCQMLLLYALLDSYSWLNVMCIHLWRTVTKINPKLEGSFCAYALYALIVPVICFILTYIVDPVIFGAQSSSDRMKNGGVFSNPALLYMFNIVIAQQLINFCIFVHVGYILWHQKKQWNRNVDSVGQKHSCQQKTMCCQILTLSIITGVFTNFYYIFAYLEMCDKTIPLILNLLAIFELFPGYLIFITYICCNKQVKSIWRNRTAHLITRIQSCMHNS